jgi:COX assembly protein 2
MHPPLDRPHPDCQEEIEQIRLCHATSSKFKFWACNEAKYAVDRCFKKEKEDKIKRLDNDFIAEREREGGFTGQNWEQYWDEKRKEKELEKSQGKA